MSPPKIVLLTLCLGLLFFISFSQTIKISINGNDVTNKSVTIEGKPTDNELKASFIISNTSDKLLQVKVRKSENSVITGTDNSFCLGECYAPAVFESSGAYAVPANQSTGGNVFYAEYFPNGKNGISEITYEVFDANDRQNKTSVNVRYSTLTNTLLTKGQFLGLSLTVWPNPVSESAISIAWSVPERSLQSTLTVHNITGRTIRRYPVPDRQGILCLPAGNLPGGIYFCTLQTGEGALLVQKFIINR